MKKRLQGYHSYQLYIYKIPSAGASGHLEYLDDSHAFTLTRDFGLRKQHILTAQDQRVGHYRVTCEAVNVSGIHSAHTAVEFEITEAHKQELVPVTESANTYVIQQTGTLTEPTDAQMEAAKKTPAVDGDYFIYQQINTSGVVLESQSLQYKVGVTERFLNWGYEAKTEVKNPNATRVFAATLAVAARAAREGETAVWTVTQAGALYQSSDHYDWSQRGNVTVLTTGAQILALADSSIHGDYALPSEGITFMANLFNSSSAVGQLAYITAEVDSQYLDDVGQQFIGNFFDVSVRMGSDVYTGQVQLGCVISNLT